MNHNNFEKISHSRRTALALAEHPLRTEFNPYRGVSIDAIRYGAAGPGRVVLCIETGDGHSHELQGFPRCHAERLAALAGPQQLAYLCDVWLNYVAWRCAH